MSAGVNLVQEPTHTETTCIDTTQGRTTFVVPRIKGAKTGLRWVWMMRRMRKIRRARRVADCGGRVVKSLAVCVAV